MKVRDVMQRRVICIDEADTLALAQQLMLWNDIRHLPVMRASDARLVGVLSERDVLRAGQRGASGSDALARPVREVMRSPAEHIHPDADLADAAAELGARKLGCLPVLDAGELVGIVAVGDVLGALAQQPVPRSRPESGSPSAPVASLMYPEPVAVHEDDTVLLVATRMARAQTRHACVVDGEGCVVGLVSARDLQRTMFDPRLPPAPEQAPARLSALRARDIMTREPTTVHEDASVSVALQLLLSLRVGALPVVDGHEHLRGIVSYLDVLAHFAESAATVPPASKSGRR